MQLRCNDCAPKKNQRGKGKEEEDVVGGGDSGGSKYCWVTTNAEFWEKLSLWEIPRESRTCSIALLLTRCKLCSSGPIATTNGSTLSSAPSLLLGV